MNVGIGTEAAQFPEKEYINGIFVAVHSSRPRYIHITMQFPKQNFCMHGNVLVSVPICQIKNKKRVALDTKYFFWTFLYILTCRKETMNARHCLYILYSCRTKALWRTEYICNNKLLQSLPETTQSIVYHVRGWGKGLVIFENVSHIGVGR
jgi:hypothetical protein